MKPIGWHSLSDSERKSYQEREDLEYENDRLREESEGKARRAKREAEYLRSEIANVRDDNNAQYDLLEHARQELLIAHNWIKARGLWEEFVGHDPRESDR